MSNILATQALQIAGMGYKVDLIIVSFVDEEAGENGILACIIRGYTGNACNFTEPSGLAHAAISSRGAQYFRITVPGLKGGTEYMYELVNPINKAIEVFPKLVPKTSTGIDIGIGCRISIVLKSI